MNRDRGASRHSVDMTLRILDSDGLGQVILARIYNIHCGELVVRGFCWILLIYIYNALCKNCFQCVQIVLYLLGVIILHYNNKYISFSTTRRISNDSLLKILNNIYQQLTMQNNNLKIRAKFNIFLIFLFFRQPHNFLQSNHKNL